jgi:hypothetical protein
VTRIKFKKGKQREFLTKVLVRINCPSLRELRKRGFDISYSALKNYYTERRNIPSNLFYDLLSLAGINEKDMDFKKLEDNYGQIEGGKKSRK